MPNDDELHSGLLAILREIDLFRDFTPLEMDQLILTMRMIRTQKNFEIIRQGDSWDSFYVILSGRVSVKIRKGSKTLKVEELQQGDFFGEMALIAQKPRNATVTSEEISELLVLSKTEFDSMLMKHPGRSKKIYHAYTDRMTRNKKKMGLAVK